MFNSRKYITRLTERECNMCRCVVDIVYDRFYIEEISNYEIVIYSLLKMVSLLCFTHDQIEGLIKFLENSFF